MSESNQGHHSRQECQRGSIPVRAALQILKTARRSSDVVVTNQGSSRIWPSLSQHELDFNYTQSTMGGAIPLALGIALAKPTRQVIVVSGDGSLLMNLGCLVTVSESRVPNLSIVLLDNRRYEVTGGQATAASQLDIKWEQIAQASGFQTADAYCDESEWRQEVTQFLAKPGPRFAALAVGHAATSDFEVPTINMNEHYRNLRETLDG